MSWREISWVIIDLAIAAYFAARAICTILGKGP
jgi:hypothetical protein